jgi:uncharacterized Zn-binding protein involved in type VI secretion
MGAPAIVQDDRISGTCAVHQVPNPTSGAPQPGPPMPFSAPLQAGLVASVLIGGRPAAVVGSSGLNTPAHMGLHPADPYVAPMAQVGRITSGSASVLIGGQPAAITTSTATCCMTPGTLGPGVPSVLIG